MSTVLDSSPPASDFAEQHPTASPMGGQDFVPPLPTGPRTVILHADDLGLLYAFNEGIRRAHLDGHLTSISLRANGQAYDHAIRDVLPDCPRLGVGIHLCLNEGPSVAPPDDVPLLLGPDRSFRAGHRWLMKLARSQAGRAQIEREFRDQEPLPQAATSR